MSSAEKTIYIATRGSALALAQANFILAECRRNFPEKQFALNIIKTTGDKLQTASLSQPDKTLPRGLFTKEIEEALLNGEADLAVHSLKDLPTSLPEGLKLAAAGKREDVRDVLIYPTSKFPDVNLQISALPQGATIATSSTRRSAQLLALRPDLKIVPIRGNVGTRLQKLSAQPELHGIILAAAGLARLGFTIDATGNLRGENIPDGLRTTFLSLEEMLPCVGQAALGIEIRENDALLETICAKLNDFETWHCVLAERAFLRAMGGGCQSPVAAFAEIHDKEIQMRVISFLIKNGQRAQATRSIEEAELLGIELAKQLQN